MMLVEVADSEITGTPHSYVHLMAFLLRGPTCLRLMHDHVLWLLRRRIASADREIFLATRQFTANQTLLSPITGHCKAVMNGEN